MESIKSQTNSSFEKYILYLAIVLSPILVLPMFANAFNTPKVAFVTFMIGLILIIKSVRSMTRNSISFSASPLDLPVILLGGAYIVSGLLQTPNKMEAYFLPGTATVVGAGAILYFIVNQLSKNDKRMLRYLLFLSASLVAVLVLFASTGVFKGMSSLPLYMQATSFSPLGGSLPALILLVSLAPIGLSLIVSERDMAKKALFGVSFAIIALAAILALFNVLPGRDTAPQLPGFRTSWFVAVDSLKQSPVLGVGPGNYLTAFNRFRPISFNATNLWSIRFTSGQSYLFTAITETGLAGAASLLLILFFVLKMGRDVISKGSKEMLSNEGATMLSLTILSVSFLIFPSTPTLLFTFFILLALVASTSEINLGMFNSGNHSSNVPFAARIPVIVATLPVVLGVLFYGFQASRILAADATYKRALDYVIANDGRGAYDTLQSSINQNPYVDRYRVSYAQINLALANSIASKEGEITDEDRGTIAQLVQQAIREGKVAVALNPQRAGNWEVLASVYRAVIPLAEGADVFAVQTYTQAIALDPLNPNTRIALGGIYYAAGAYEDSIDVFKLAVATKPDHSNAHYNLAVAYRENGNLDRAIAEMSAVLSLVNRDSEDFNIATQVLEDLQNKKQAAAPAGEELTPPPTGEEPALEEPIELTEDEAPPTPEPTSIASPEASATPAPSTSPTATPLP
jgi:tetratricopeptide (TPR) repeat protein